MIMEGRGIRRGWHFRAFTLVELLVVIIIVSILAAVAIPRFSDSALKSKEATLRANLKLIREAGDRAEADTGLIVPVSALASATAPASGWRRQAMNTSWSTASVIASTWRGPYLHAIPFNDFSRNNTYSSGQTNTPTTAWTKFSIQSFNPSCYYYPSTRVGSNGRPYREW
jgi:prepilin-type N-terminal cleavage/methylation domain-containing protein